MYSIKKYFSVMLVLVLTSLSANAVDISNKIKDFSKTTNTQKLIQEANEQQNFISKYLKKHSKEQNLELFLTWEENINYINQNSSIFSFNFNKYPNDEYMKTLQNQFSKTGIVPNYNYASSKYNFSIDYINGYDLFGKYIPNDWSLYLKNLSIEQADNFDNYIEKNEKCLAMWEDFILKYPNFEKNWIVLNKIQNYENSYFRKGVFIGETNGAYIYNANVIKAYDTFSQKYPNSKYKTICTRLSNLKKLKHDFISPYVDEFNNIASLKSEFNINQQFKNSTKNDTKYVFDINNNIWLTYTDEYIRGNYMFLAKGQDENSYKLYNKNYIVTPPKMLPNRYNFDNLFIKNGRLYIFSKEELKIKELKYSNSDEISFVEVDKQNLKEIYKGVDIIYFSSLINNEENNYKITIKSKKYPKSYLLYNDKEEIFPDYTFETNLNIKPQSESKIEVKDKATLKFVPKKSDSEESVSSENENKDIKPTYIFIFE